MSATPNLGLQYLDPSQSQPEVKINEAWNILDDAIGTVAVSDSSTSPPIVARAAELKFSGATVTHETGGVARVTISGGGGGSAIDVTDGITTVSAITEIDFTSGAVVTASGSSAHVAIAGGGGSLTVGAVGSVTQINFTGATVTSGGAGIADVAISGGGGGGGGVPTTIDDCVFWFKADSIVAPAVGASVPSLQNEVPWYPGNSAGGTGLGAVISATQLNSINTLTFPGGVAGRYTLPGGLNLNKCTVFAVLNPAANPPGDIIAGPAQAFELSSTGGCYLYMGVSNVAVIAINGSTIPISTWTQINVTYDSATGNYAFRAGSTAQSSGSSSHVCGAPTTTVAWNPASGGGDFNGEIAEIIIYNRVLTGTEIGVVEAYLLAKWGV